MGRPAAFLGIALTLAAACSPAGAQRQCGGIINRQGILSTPNFPNPPPSGQICKWTLQPSSKKLVSLTFFDFDIGPNSYLDIYRGTTVGKAADLLTTYTNRGPGPTTINVAGSVTLLFRGAASQQSRGFTITFTSVSPQPRSATEDRFTDCGGEATGAGTVTSLGHPGWYPINLKCTWTLTPREVGAQIKVEFSAFDVEADFDTVKIYTGPEDKLALFATYTGNTLPQAISLDTPVTVVFDSDNINAGNSGFSLKFSTVAEPREGGPAAPPQLPVVTVSGPFASDHNYYFVSAARDYNSAQAYCSATLGANLVKIDSKYEHDFLVGIIRGSSVLQGNNFWIGLRSQRGNPFAWQWLCGNTPVGYTNWGLEQPDSADELCTHLWVRYANYEWNNAHCTDTAIWSVPTYFICEKRGPSVC